MIGWKVQFFDNPHTPRFQRGALECSARASRRRRDVHPISLAARQVLEEIEVPERAPKLAVGDCGEPDLLLSPDCGFDFLVFYRLELSRRYLTAAVLLPRLLQGSRPQEAPDLIGAERRFGPLHCFLRNVPARMLAIAEAGL